MTIEEATIIFGKNHDQWSDRERREFVRALEIKDLQVPHNLALAAVYYYDLSDECADRLEYLMTKRHEGQ